MALMSLANLNLTFGSEDEPLLEWLDEFIIPALTSGIKREIKNKEKRNREILCRLSVRPSGCFLTCLS